MIGYEGLKQQGIVIHLCNTLLKDESAYYLIVIGVLQLNHFFIFFNRAFPNAFNLF